MDTNQIKKDGFSNPDTEQLFDQQWDHERMLSEYRARKDCGWCRDRVFIVDAPEEYKWVLCLSDRAPHWLETVAACFSCPYQQPMAVEDGSAPWEPPSYPRNDGRGRFDIGI